MKIYIFKKFKESKVKKQKCQKGYKIQASKLLIIKKE
jgi:hypothetical protein